MTQTECISPIMTAMKARRDQNALAGETLAKMFEKGDEELVAQVPDIYIL